MADEEEPTPEPPVPDPTMNPNSILHSVKKLLGLSFDYEIFDVDILIHINSAFGTLHQLGVGPKDPFSIEGAEEEWAAFIGEIKDINSVKSYVYGYVRLIFDPPSTAHAEAALEKMLDQWAWRLRVASETNV